jgi:hypothetical protein
MPRASNRITRLKLANRRWNRASKGSSSILSMGTTALENTRRSTEPDPNTWKAMCREPSRAKRISGLSCIAHKCARNLATTQRTTAPGLQVRSGHRLKSALRTPRAQLMHGGDDRAHP